MKDDSASTSFKERYEMPTMSLPGYLRGEQKLPRDQNGLVERAERTIAGGVRPVVVTQYNRIAYSSADGAKLWEQRLNDVSSSSPITFSLDGKQYVAIVTGQGGFHAGSFAPLVPEMKSPPDRGAAVWVFALAN